MAKEIMKGETPLPSENEVSERLISPLSARLIGITFEPSLLKPDGILDPAKTEAFSSHLESATPERISYAGVESLSLQSRTEYWQKKEKPFAEQNKEWNKATWTWIKAQIGQEAEYKDDARAAFTSLGITPENEAKADDLSVEAEKFRKTYLGEKSDIKKFVADIAAGCIKNDEIQLVTLENRLKAVEGLFSAFGDTFDIPALINEHAVAHGLLMQSAEKKKALLPFLLPYLRVPFMDAQAEYAKKRLALLLPPDRTIMAPSADTSVSDDTSEESMKAAASEDHDPTTTTSGGDNDPTTSSNIGDSDPTTSGMTGDYDKTTGPSATSSGADSDRSTRSTTGESGSGITSTITSSTSGPAQGPSQGVTG